MLKDKRGVSTGQIVLIALAVVLLIGIVIIGFFGWQWFPALPNIRPDSSQLEKGTQVTIDWNNAGGLTLKYVFGIPSDKSTTVTAIIVLIAVWLIFFLAFGDTIAQYGFFSKGIGWVIGFALTVILANMQFYYNLLVNLLGLFSFLAGASIIVALGSIFAAMLVVNLGLGGAGTWIYKRKVLQEASKAKVDIDVGGTITEGVLANLGKLGRGFKRSGETATE